MYRLPPLFPLSLIILHKDIICHKQEKDKKGKTMNKKELYIPTNVPDNNDIISGFGIKEIIIAGIGTAASVVFAVLVYIISSDIVASVLLPFAAIAILIVFIRRDQCSESIIDKLKFVWYYMKSQKRYGYQYYDYIEENLRKQNDSSK